MRVFVAAAAAFAVVAASCSLFTSLSGFSNGDADDGTEGGASSADGGFTEDAANAIDGNSATDASTPFCTSHPMAAFCADFDRVVKFNDDWPEQEIDPSANVALAETQFISAPRSLRATLPAKGEGVFYALIAKRIQTTVRRPIRLELDLYVTQPAWISSTTGNVSFFSIGYNGPQLSVSQEFFFDARNLSSVTTRVKRDEPNSLEFTDTNVAIPRNEWVHVKVESDFKAGGSGYVRVWFNDQEVLSKINTTFQAEAQDYAFVALGLSRYNNGSTPPFEAFYDNVLVEFY